ncbi:DUF2889 domain-containing protein [Actinocorallia herbida]|nr:DUF2889 domain-containing protein [Actinocorallia herbida]
MGTPPRAPGSVRRTTTIDMLRPAGIDGTLLLIGKGRDLATNGSGGTETRAEAEVRADVDYHDGWLLTGLSTDPGLRGLAGLVGATVGSGFRRRLDTAEPGLAGSGGPLYQLLDDFPVAALVSGHAVGAAAARDEPLDTSPGGHRLGLVADQCAGFVTDGTLMSGLVETGRPPIVTGPDAPPLPDPADPLGWHLYAPLPPHSMRRARRIDVAPGPGGTAIDVLFRDSYVLPNGTETVIHEYTVAAEARDGVLSRCEATARVLPWTECPGALASARRLAGTPLADLRARIRAEFTGTSTCTHLNDTLRALQDVPFFLPR